MGLNNKLLFAGVLSVWCLLVPSSSRVRGDEIQWRSEFQAALREASEKNRPIFIDVMRPEGCFYCMKMDANTFRDPAIVRILNEQFIPLKHDGERIEIKLDGIKVDHFPTLVTAAPDGKIINKIEGFQYAADLKQVLEKSLAGLTPKGPLCRAEVHIGPGNMRRDSIWTGPRWLTVRSAGFTAQPCNIKEERQDRAREMLVRAADSYRRQQWHVCLQLCRSLIQTYPDLPESNDARQMTSAINPEQLENLGKNLSENLGQVYWELAQVKLRQNQPDQAIPYLERIVQSCPGSRLAGNAHELLGRLGQPVMSTKILPRS